MPSESQMFVSKMFYTFDDVVSPYMGAFFAAFILAVIATPIMARIARKHGVVDKPDLTRKLHGEPVAYLGGVALFIGWFGGVMASYLAEPHSALQTPGISRIQLPWEVLIGAMVVVAVGVRDDIKPIRARYKLLGQITAGAILAIHGVGMELVSGSLTRLGGVLDIDFGWVPQPLIALVSVGMVIVFVVGACNAANLMDGLDGLASGVTAVVTLGLTFIAVCLAMGLYTMGGAYSPLVDPVRIVMCLALLGAVMGFLPYNFKPASIFMGDAGSMLLGYVSVSIILLFGEKGDPLLVMAGLTVFTLPILDTALAIVRRKAQRKPITCADSGHLHHLLTRSGLSVRQAVIALYGIALGFAVIGGSMIFIRLRFVAAVFMIIFAFIAVMAFKVAHRYHLAEEQAKLFTDVSPTEAQPALQPAAAAATEPEHALRHADVRKPAAQSARTHAAPPMPEPAFSGQA